MKVTIEKVERLMERADVGYETARDALEAVNGDLLEAVIALERDGKLGPNAGKNKAATWSTGSGSLATVVGQSYGADGSSGTRVEPNFTFPEGGPNAGASGKKADPNAQKKGAYRQQSGPYHYSDESTAFTDGASRFFRWIGRVLRASVVNCFEIWRRGERVVYFPVILFLFCLIPWVFFVALAILLIGLFCGWRYRFSGPHLGRQSMNETMDRMADIAEEERTNERKDPDR